MALSCAIPRLLLKRIAIAVPESCDGESPMPIRFTMAGLFRCSFPCAVIVAVALSPTGCSDGDRSTDVNLVAQVPDTGASRSLRWSPKGEKLFLLDDDGKLTTNLRLGPDDTEPLPLRLEKGPGQVFYDRLLIDRDRDGVFEDNELLETEPTEIRGRMWSSFETVVNVPAVDPETNADVINAYPLSFWFVDDPSVEEDELVLRFSRRGWMEGRLSIDGVDAVVLITESVMDGVFDRSDSWAMASRDSASNVYSVEYARPATRHAWLLDRAYEVSELHPSGRRLVLRPFDPGMTRAEEAAVDDHLAEDRRAARSGDTVAFLHDFENAEALAQAEGKSLFVDFETEWCGPCHVMDEWVYTADVVIGASASYVSVKVDGDERPDLKERFLVEGYPTLLLVDADGTVLKRAAGYQSVKEMVEFLTEHQTTP